MALPNDETTLDHVVAVNAAGRLGRVEQVWMPDGRLANVLGRTRNVLLTDLGVAGRTEDVTPARVVPVDDLPDGTEPGYTASRHRVVRVKHGRKSGGQA